MPLLSAEDSRIYLCIEVVGSLRYLVESDSTIHSDVIFAPIFFSRDDLNSLTFWRHRPYCVNTSHPGTDASDGH